MDFTTRWLSILGVGTVLFAVSLIVLRVPVRTIIVFFVIGMAIVTLWLYADRRSNQQKKNSAIAVQACACSICKHDEANQCIQQKCACCIVMKGDTIIGHSVNPLQ